MNYFKVVSLIETFTLFFYKNQMTFCDYARNQHVNSFGIPRKSVV